MPQLLIHLSMRILLGYLQLIFVPAESAVDDREICANVTRQCVVADDLRKIERLFVMCGCFLVPTLTPT